MADSGRSPGGILKGRYGFQLGHMKGQLTSVLVLLGTSAAIACGCGATHYPIDLDRDFAVADKVFRATVQDVIVISSLTEIRGVGQIGREFFRAEVVVTETFKGDTSELIYVVTNTSDASCGVPIRSGDDFVFFLDEKDVAHACSSSRSAQIAERSGWDWDAFVSAVGEL